MPLQASREKETRRAWASLGHADAWPEAPASGEATAFVRPAAAEDAYDVRYFAGGAEIAFCGHATLAAADAVLDSTPGARVDLETSSGKTVAATRSRTVP